jgi:uncharacterized protein (DUF2147 family)
VFPAPNEDPNPKRDKCEGANQNALVVGLVILSGLTKECEEYVGGQIFDTDYGKVYRSKVSLTDNGKKLSVRGYIGVPVLGRSQTWLRQELRKNHEGIRSRALRKKARIAVGRHSNAGVAR